MALYYAASFVDKTVVTAKTVPVYTNVDTDKVHSYIPARTALTVYSYLSANPNKNRPNNWFMFQPAIGNPFYIPIIKGYFDVEMYEEAGIKTAVEVDKDKQKALSVFGLDSDGNTLGIDDYIKKYLPIATLLAIGYYTVKHGIPYLLKKL